MGRIVSHFLDSGAFTLHRKGGKADHRAYMDRYARFLKKHRDVIDYYANVDVIGDPEGTWQNQLYLEEEHGLKPVPVVHFGTKKTEKWISQYVERGHIFIGLGGLVGRAVTAHRWIQDCFRLVGGDRGEPCVRLHGFGIVNYVHLCLYPWWSVDSAAWVKEAGRWATVFVPHKRRGRFVFTPDDPPYKVGMGRNRSGQGHYLSLNQTERKIVDEWLDQIGVSAEKALEDQVERARANLLFFEALRSALPRWPRSSPQTGGFAVSSLSLSKRYHKPRKLRIYYSGGGDRPETGPEAILDAPLSIMMTFYTLPNRRWKAVSREQRRALARVK